MEPDGDGFLRQKRWCVFRNHRVRMIDPEHEVSRAIGSALAIFAPRLPNGILVRAEDMFRTEIPRSNAVCAAEQARHFLRRHPWHRAAELVRFNRFAHGAANVASQ